MKRKDLIGIIEGMGYTFIRHGGNMIGTKIPIQRRVSPSQDIEKLMKF